MREGTTRTLLPVLSSDGRGSCHRPCDTLGFVVHLHPHGSGVGASVVSLTYHTQNSWRGMHTLTERDNART